MSKLVQDTVSSVSYNIENVLYNSRKFVKHISGPAPKKKKNKMERENSANCKCSNETQRDILEIYKILNVLYQPNLSILKLN